MTARALTAQLVQILVDYEGPQLLLLRSNRGHNMLAVAITSDTMESPFFAAEVNDRIYNQYFDQKADLHYTFEHSLGHNFYVFDLTTLDAKETVALRNADRHQIENPHNWPSVGFFARSHTTRFNTEPDAGFTKTYIIDGRWGADDFSHFHAKIADLYGLFGVINRLDGSDRRTEMGFIRDAIHSRFWRGGGSYVGFYDSLVMRNSKLKLPRLNVVKISYASPGELVLRGDKAALSEVTTLMDVFDSNWREFRSAHRTIYSAMRKERLLSASPQRDFSSDAARAFIEKETLHFASQLGLDHIEELRAACNENVAVFAKVVLSVYRRANELYTFHAQGRVQRV